MDCNTNTTGLDYGTAVNYPYSTCWFRLPCGYCSQLGRLCPMPYGETNDITWNKLTCEAKNDQR